MFHMTPYTAFDPGSEWLKSGLTSNQQRGLTETGPRFKVSSERPEKRGIDLAIPGLVVKRIFHYTTAAPTLVKTLSIGMNITLVTLILFCFSVNFKFPSQYRSTASPEVSVDLVVGVMFTWFVSLLTQIPYIHSGTFLESYYNNWQNYVVYMTLGKGTYIYHLLYLIYMLHLLVIIFDNICFGGFIFKWRQYLIIIRCCL